MTKITIARTVIYLGIMGVSLTFAPATHAGLIHQYQLNGSFADDLAGPSLIAAGGTLNATSYSFGPGQGLSLSNGLTNIGNYSVELIFNFTSINSYRKILDFKDLTVDSGLYNLNSNLIFYSVATGSGGAFAANLDVRLILTRDSATNQVVGYIDGVQKLSFTDSSSLGTFSGANNIMQYFKDDVVTGHSEASAGVVDLIRIYDAPLTAAEVAALGGPGPVAGGPIAEVPEPASLALWSLMSVAGLAAWRRRKRANVA